jgi:hypothetical protein
MFRMGHDFKAPPKRDKKWWANVELLAKAGFTFHSCGRTGPRYHVYYPDTPLGKRLHGAVAFITERHKEKFPEELKSQKKNGWRKPKVPAFMR